MRYVLIVMGFLVAAPAFAQESGGTSGSEVVGVGATAIAAEAARRARKRKRAQKIVAAEAARWKWDEARQKQEVRDLLRRNLK